MRNPVQLAWEAATIDRLSGGRFELGLGAGHTPQEYAATGIAHAGAHSDVIGLQGLRQTRSDGHRHKVKWDPAWLDAQIDQIRAGAGDRFEQLELNALVQRVAIAEDRAAALGAICDEVEGLSPEHAEAIPYLLVGTVDEIVAHLERCRARWGITYFVVRELETFAPILDAVS